NEEISEEVIHRPDKVSDLDEAQKRLLKAKKNTFRGVNLEFLDPQAFTVLKEFAADRLKPNVKDNGLETDARSLKARTNIKNVVIKIQRGESIIRSGDRFEPWHLTVIKGIREERLKSSGLFRFAGTFIFVNLVLLIVYFFAAKYIRKFNPSRRDMIFLGSTLILFLVTLRFGVFLSDVLRDALPFSVSQATIYYVIPMAAAAMLVRFILNSETALVFAVVLSLFAGIFVENNLELTVFYLISGVFAAHVIAHVDKRSSVLLCGAYVGLVNAATIFSLNLLAQVTVAGSLTFSQMAFNMVSAFFGGVLTSMMVLILTPIAESLFNYTTDIKLLELANLSHPLLREMIVRAPGTYHHSQLVGILSEAAAQSIGANPLLSRVACYYHDIGKMRKPHYFIENQSGDNAHDRLSPSMSALIIESHVKDGIEMAREYKLPQRIADIIPQHQGTKLMGFFYSKAKQMEGTFGPVDEKDYRYPGPKPQTREAGIIMLADTVEAASRALPEKTPGKIRMTVEKLINQHFVDEQLDECDLTLKDLHLIAESFIKILIGIYHQRVEYPESDSPDLKRASSESNISPLFRNRDKKNPPTPGAA
ncbi:MAG: HDIG domain-containing protein, partial [Deltaproteobacteria bacterium]|nr:HDIG domain-containing protein [Deltaproteobacteria bacterium]